MLATLQCRLWQIVFTSGIWCRQYYHLLHFLLWKWLDNYDLDFVTWRFVVRNWIVFLVDTTVVIWHLIDLSRCTLEGKDNSPLLGLCYKNILADLSNQNGESTWSNQHVLCVVSKSSNKWSWNHQKSGIWQQLNWLGVFRSQRVTVIRWAYHMAMDPSN